MSFNIAIDGPAGAGKTSLSKAVANKLGFMYLSSGEIYRAFAYQCLQTGIDIHDREQCNAQPFLFTCKAHHTVLGYMVNFHYGDKNINKEIHKPEVTLASMVVSVYPQVRKRAIQIQHAMAEKYDLVLEGRDVGSVVLPNADVKIFIEASLNERAKRRYNQMVKAGDNDTTFAEIKQAIKTRDQKDKSREIITLVRNYGDHYVNTTTLNFDEAKEYIVEVVDESLKQASRKINPIVDKKLVACNLKFNDAYIKR